MTKQTGPAPTATSGTSLSALADRDAPAADRFDRITRLAALTFMAKGAQISRMDSDGLWTKASHGLGVGDGPLVDSLCRHVVREGQPLFIPDLSQDERFAGLPSRVAAGSLRMYAGVPLRDEASHVTIGTLCILDTKSRDFTDDQHSILQELALWAEAEIHNDAAVNRLAQTLLDRQQRLETLLLSLPEAVLVVDGEGAIEETNAAGRQMFGGDGGLAQPLGHRLRDLSYALTPERRRHSADTQPRPPVRQAATAIRIDGSEFSAEVSIAALSDDLTHRSLVLVRDLGDVEQAEAAAHRQRLQTELILSTLTEGVVRLDAAGFIRYANVAAARLLRARASDLLALHFAAAVQGELGDASQPSAEALAEHVGSAVRPNELLQRRDGSDVVVDMAITLIRESGHVQGAVVSMRDASERLARQQREDEFVAVVSHELRTPLTSIKASLGLLYAGVLGQLSPGVQDLLAIAVTNADRLLGLVRDLLDFERLSSGGMPMSSTVVDLGELIRRVATLSQSAAQAAGVDVSVEAPGGVLASVDEDRIVQALTNLLGNAVKFSAPGSKVSLSLQLHGDRIMMSVQDPGRGIPSDKLERIFERFGQAEVSSDTALGGTGLGLPIARSIVQAHNGTLTAHSTLGEGSTFVIDLPAYTSQT